MKRKAKRYLLTLCCVFLAYVILGCLLPLLQHRGASGLVRQNFSPADCYAETAGTERVLCIDDNLEALLWRIRVIEAAQKTVVLSTFDFADDESGQDMMAVLLRAADRGVQVRIIVDGISGMLKLNGSSRFAALISHPKVEARLYNPVNLLQPWRMTLRLHDKYVMADDWVYILGGRNTSNLFLGDYSEKYNADRDLLVYETVRDKETGSLSELKAYFEEIWDLPCNKEMTNTGDDRRVKEAGSWLRTHYDELRETYPEAFAETDYAAATMETNRITLLTNSQEPVNREPDLWYMLYQLMLEGREVLIQTPYIICSRDMYQDLTSLAGEADKVEVITNGTESGANPWGCADYLNQKGRIQKTGVETYEFAGKQSSHAKMILIDDRISIVGSYNLDMRSTYLDTEMMLVVDCQELNRELTAAMDQDKQRSRHIYPDGEMEYGALYEPQAFPVWKKMFYGVLRGVILPIRHLL